MTDLRKLENTKREHELEPEPLRMEDLTVLVVDDDQNVLRSLARLLKTEEYKAVALESGSKAIEVMKQRPVHLILTDQRMPEMSGIELLEKAKEMCPDAVRVILTGYSELRTAELAINKVGIFRFITKPWNDQDLRVTVREGLKQWLLQDYNRRLLMRIEEQNRDLWELNQDLEEKVEQRTRQLKMAQAKLIQSEKMASLGLLAGGVAHEINNPLSGILGLVQLVLMESKDKQVISDLRQIEQAVLQCRDIVAQLLSFARQSDDRHREEVYLPMLVDKTVALINHELRDRRIELEVNCPEHLPLLWANPSQIQQVLINLIMNSAQAMKRYGKIALRALQSQEGGVEIEVEDQGPGMPDHVKDKIFDPFFTTKQEGEGTGLGLSITHGIIKDHHGKIQVESVPDQGTIFRIQMPPAEQATLTRSEAHAG